MICLINGMRHPDHYFWNCLHCLATEAQIMRIFGSITKLMGFRIPHIINSAHINEF